VTIAWRAAGLSDTGRVRRGNEDAFRTSPDLGIFIVADGMGGHAAGEVASRLAADAALEILGCAPLSGQSDVEDALRSAFHEAYRRILEFSDNDSATRGMGTTLTIAVLSPTGALHVGHLGDSRIYQLSGTTLRQLTHDHTWVQQEVDAGRVAAEAARSHPFSHILTKVLTADDPPVPDIATRHVNPRDRLLLCSDGLYNMLEGQVILELLSREQPLPDIANALVEAANASGGADNITVVVVDIGN
jgi:PPM family protein phosphatase